MAKGKKEDRYVVLLGADRYVNSYLKRGELIVRNEVVACGEGMAAVLLRQEYKDSRTSEMRPMWREATKAEIEGYLNRLENLDPETADIKLLAEQARLEALERGDVEEGQVREIERAERAEEELQPKRRTRRRRTTARN